MLKIGFVVRAGSEQYDTRILTVPRDQSLKRFAIALKEVSKPAHVSRAKHIGQNARCHQAIFQRVAGARRGLSSVRKYPPLPIRRACQIRGVHVQKHSTGRLETPARAQESRVGKYQLRRKHSIAKQSLWPVQIGQYRIE